MEPDKLFEKYACRQPWGGSPGVKVGYDYKFDKRHCFSVLKMEQIGCESDEFDELNEFDEKIDADGKVETTVSHNGSSILIQFSGRRAFDSFVEKMMWAPTGKKVTEQLYFDSCDF
jgi:hypothetical protein